MNCRIEIFCDNRWQTAATFEPDPQTLDKGIKGGCRLEYDFDYAVKILVTVKNVGEAGPVELQVTLLTPNGSFERQQEFNLESNQGRQVTFRFHEPTIDATNMTYQAKCSPS